MSTAVLSIGSNLGDRLANLRGCVAMLGEGVRAASPVYSTVPWLPPREVLESATERTVEGGAEQDDFLNAILLVEDPAADAWEWLRRGRCCEAAARRTREVRWGPRTLDVDVIDVELTQQDDPHLTLPHPRAHRRAFVLVPWLDVAPRAVLPGYGPVAELVAALSTEQRRGVQRRDDLALYPSGMP